MNEAFKRGKKKLMLIMMYDKQNQHAEGKPFSEGLLSAATFPGRENTICISI